MAIPDQEMEYLRDLMKQRNAGDITTTEMLAAGRNFRAEPVKVPAPPIIPFVPDTEVLPAKSNLFRERMGFYRSSQGGQLSVEDAARKARDELDLLADKPATTEYSSYLSPRLVSDIRDAEKGVVFDPETKRYRKGGTAELLWESMFPQVLAEGPEARAMEQELVTSRPEDTLATKAIKTAAPLLITPSRETGQMVETPVAAAFRNLGLFPAAAAAAIERGAAWSLMDVEQVPEYRLADSGTFADQLITNIAKGQSLGGLFEATPQVRKPLAKAGRAIEDNPLFGAASYVGEDLPFWTGIALEMPMPVTGAVAVPRAAGQALSAAGRQVAKVSPKTGLAIGATGDVLKYARFKATQKVVDEIADAAMSGRKSADIMAEMDQAPWSSAERWAKRLDSHELKREASDSIGRHVATIGYLKSMSDEGQLTDEIIDGLAPTDFNKNIKAAYRSKVHGAVIDAYHDALKTAAEMNEGMARLFNQADEGAEMAMRLVDGTPDIRGRGRLGMQIQDELFRVRLSRAIADDLPKKTIAEVLERLSKIEKPSLDPGDFPELPRATVEDMVEATSKAVARNAETFLLDMMPENLVVMGGDVVARREALTPGAMRQYNKAISRLLKNIKFEPTREMYALPPAIREEMASILVQELGAATIRRSKNHQRLLADILKGGINQRQYMFMESNLKGHFARAHVGGFDLVTGGEQMRRATIPTELATSVVKMEEARSTIVLSTRDLVNSLRIVMSDRIPWMVKTPKQFIKQFEDVSAPPEWHAFRQQVNNQLAQVFPMFKKELAEAAKSNQYPMMRPTAGFDGILKNTWKDTADRTINQTDDFVRNNMRGDWGEYARVFLGEKADDIELKVSRRAPKDDAAAAMVLRREITLDYKLFEEKADAWDRILSAYYGGKEIQQLKDSLKLKLTGVQRKRSPTDAPVTASMASSLLDFSVNNLAKITARMEEMPEFRGKGLKTLVTRKEAPTIALMDWVLGYRRGNIFGDMFTEFIDRNPQYALDFSPHPNSPYARLDLPAVKEKYQGFVDYLNRFMKARGAGPSPIKDVKQTKSTVLGILKRLKELGLTPEEIRYQMFPEFSERPTWMTDIRKPPRGEQVKTMYLPGKRGGKKGRRWASRYIFSPDKITDFEKRMEGWLAGTEPVPMFRSKKQFDRLRKEVIEKQSHEAEDAWVNALSEMHIEAVRRTTAKNRHEAIRSINSKISDTGNTEPNLENVQRKLRDDLAEPFADLSLEVRTKAKLAMDKAGIKEGVQKATLKSINAKLFKIYSGAELPGGALADNPVVTAVGDLLGHLQQGYKAHGIAIGADLENTMTTSYISAQPGPAGPRGLALSSTELAQLGKIQDYARTNRLGATLDTLRADTPGKWALQVIKSAFTTARRNQTTALLGGFPFPNLRYQGQNILTAPLIMATTLGIRRAGLAYNEVFKTFKLPFMGVDDIVFTSATGKEWTAGELRTVMDRTNIGFTRGSSIEFSEAVAHEALQAARLSVAGKGRAPAGIVLEKWLVPWKRNYFQEFADGSDNLFRRAVFLSAIREGKGVEQSAMLAQRSLLDYGAMSQVEKQHFGNVLLFWAFRRQMMAETLNSVYRSTVKGEGPGVVLSSMRASMRQQQQNETWMYADDEGKKRLYSMFKSEFDGVPFALFGPANPGVELFETMINIGTGVFQAMTSPEQISLLELLGDVQLTPAINHLAKVFERESKEGKDPPSVPPDWVWMSKSLGAWDIMKSKFGIRSNIHRRKAGVPEWGDDSSQYRFGNNNDYKNFLWWQLASIYLGVKGNITTYSYTAMAAEVGPGEPMKAKRLGAPASGLYALNAQTSLPMTTRARQIAFKQMEIQKALENLRREEDIFKD